MAVIAIPSRRWHNLRMRPADLEILYEDNHVLAVNKPAGIPTQGFSPGETSLVQVAKDYIKTRYDKPGNVYLGVVSRLDAAVTGAVIFARTSKAAARLSAHFAAHGTPTKKYWALLEAAPHPPQGTCRDWLWHDENHRQVRVVDAGQAGAREARLNYRTLRSYPAGTLVEIELETGRKHQIRVQLAARGWPIRGDKKYGARQPWPQGIALHARHLEIKHPVRDSQISLVAPLPASWREAHVKDPAGP